MSENHYTRPNQPDVLEVIANLSSNEVFTPPRVVNAVLDLLPPHVWSDPSLRWLDPGSKTGVFPREITKRLMVGLAEAIPDEQARLHHILNEMVFAFAITDMTAMMTRRSLYCSKDASSALAAAPLATPEGNVWHQRIKHSYDSKGRCTECGGTKTQLEQPGRDNYAYGFIHKEGRQQITKETNMKFDVVVGNPPYQMDADAEGQNVVPIYDKFVDEAIKLNPQFIAMIMPSRWLAGGKWLDGFRDRMLNDTRIRKMVDYPNASELFPGVEIKGGVLYFLWDRDNPGSCAATTRRGDDVVGPTERNLGQYDVFVRDARALTILEKVLAKKEPSFADLVSTRDPFGPALSSNFTGYRKNDKKKDGDLKLYMNQGGSRVTKWVPSEFVTKNLPLVKKWKLLVPKAGSDGGQKLPDVVLGQPLVSEPGSVCTLTYLAIGPFDTKTVTTNVDAYMRTRFARFLVSLRKISQDTTQKVFTWVPQQTWDRTWTDAELYKKYGITKEEQEYIEAMVKEMPA
jgi:site-specific DNA-methyltransferase (adenine-specific)